MHAGMRPTVAGAKVFAGMADYRGIALVSMRGTHEGGLP